MAHLGVGGDGDRGWVTRNRGIGDKERVDGEGYRSRGTMPLLEGSTNRRQRMN
jgi:hypothetical protein